MGNRDTRGVYDGKTTKGHERMPGSKSPGGKSTYPVNRKSSSSNDEYCGDYLQDFIHKMVKRHKAREKPVTVGMGCRPDCDCSDCTRYRYLNR